VPTYQYACTECGHAFEQFQSFTDEALTECPTCGGRLRKVWGSVGIVFKGSGFYRNDSREAAKPDKDKSDKNKDTSKDKSGTPSKDTSSSGDSSSSSSTGGSEKKSDSTPTPSTSGSKSSAGSAA
jgi:putative FmdB family regulatory protein